MISSPLSGSFKHIAHMGYDADTGRPSEGVDPSWIALLEDLEGKGVSRKIIQQEMEYIKSFVQDAQGAPRHKTKPQPPPADTEWSSEGVDPSWVALLENLEGKGVSRQIIQQEIEYIKPFVRDAQDALRHKTKPQPPPVPHRRSHVPSTDLHLQVKPSSPSPASMNRQNNS